MGPWATLLPRRGDRIDQQRVVPAAGRVMGAARGTYTPDMVLLLNPLSDQELGTLDGKKGDEEAGKKVRERDAEAGFARQRLSIVKGRDGVQRGRVDLRFHFRQSRFEEEGLGRAPLRHERRREHATA